MWQMAWPILVVIGANIIYHISAKSTPDGIDLFASLTMTYIIAGIVSFAMFLLTSESKNILQEMSKANFDACPTRKALVITPAAGHGLSFPVDQERYIQKLREFFPDAST